VFLQKDNKDEKKQFKLIEELEKLIDITKWYNISEVKYAKYFSYL
jgi:hypothetical protein